MKKQTITLGHSGNKVSDLFGMEQKQFIEVAKIITKEFALGFGLDHDSEKGWIAVEKLLNNRKELEKAGIDFNKIEHVMALGAIVAKAEEAGHAMIHAFVEDQLTKKAKQLGVDPKELPGSQHEQAENYNFAQPELKRQKVVN